MATTNAVVIHGGGPTPVINGSLYGVITESLKTDAIHELYGAQRGMAGLLDGNLLPLKGLEQSKLDGLLRSPGSAIGSSRYKVQEEDYERIIAMFKQHDIRYVFLNGGNDTMDTANQVRLSAETLHYELNIIGIPKTIDNDLAFTDHCPGYGSAARYIAISSRELDQDNRSLPVPISIFEVMGRNTGWLAASSALAHKGETDGPHLIYMPEKPITPDSFLSDVEDVYKQLGRAVIVVSEGIRLPSGELMSESDSAANVDAFGHKLPGNVSVYLTSLISGNLKIRTRNEKPGLLGRTSIVHLSQTDQEEAVQLGKEAVQKAAAGETGIMLTIQRESDAPYAFSIGSALLKDVANVERFLPEEYMNDHGNGVTDAFHTYASPLIGEALPDFVSFNT